MCCVIFFFVVLGVFVEGDVWCVECFYVYDMIVVIDV